MENNNDWQPMTEKFYQEIMNYFPIERARIFKLKTEIENIFENEDANIIKRSCKEATSRLNLQMIQLHNFETEIKKRYELFKLTNQTT